MDQQSDDMSKCNHVWVNQAPGTAWNPKCIHCGATPEKSSATTLLTMADIEAELRDEISSSHVLDYQYLDGFKHGMIAALCRQNGWKALPPEMQQESARLQKWLMEVCAK